MQLPPFHTAEEMREISNLAHWIEGGVLALAALVALAQAGRRLTGERTRLLWPGFIFLAGLFLVAYLLIPHHGLENSRLQWGFVFGQPQQRQHVVIGLLVLVSGAVELTYRVGRLRDPFWQFVWPAAVASIGLLFLTHPQHGTSEAVLRATLIHRILGVSFLAVAVLRAGDVLHRERSTWFRFAWPAGLLVTAGLLAAYREPEGAYHSDPAGHTRPVAPGDSAASGDRHEHR